MTKRTAILQFAARPESRPTLDQVGERQLPPNKAAKLLEISVSWLAKARVRGDGPPYSKVGRAVRYSPSLLEQWLRSCQRSSTSE